MHKSAGKSPKFTPISNADIASDRILLPGRHPCTCEASRHSLINNCLECGRIVCMQEGSGPCFTCKNLVCTENEKEIILRKSKASMKLFNKLMADDNNPSFISDTKSEKLKTALEHRDKLLEFDRNVEKRTKVIDDQKDFFQLNSSWLSEKERAFLTKKHDELYDTMHNRRNQKVTFDFAGRKVVEEKPDVTFDPDELLKPESYSIFNKSDFTSVGIPIEIHPEYQDLEQEYVIPHKKDPNKEKRINIRIQDKELQEMSDEGYCLTIQQPFASLLISGIKKHEGRMWYASHRGRLWIHVSTKVPTKAEISSIENLYRENEGIKTFPKRYPTGCLLGCVDLVDCLPQEEYKCRFPNGEVSDSYVLICENFQELPIKIPMKGDRRIYKMESHIHQAAKNTLRKKL